MVTASAARAGPVLRRRCRGATRDDCDAALDQPGSQVGRYMLAVGSGGPGYDDGGRAFNLPAPDPSGRLHRANAIRQRGEFSARRFGHPGQIGPCAQRRVEHPAHRGAPGCRKLNAAATSSSPGDVRPARSARVQATAWMSK
jgi:hypothetical protein